MSTRARDGAAVRIPPPLIFVALLFVGYALGRWTWPLALPLDAQVLRLATLLTALLGGGLLAAAMGLFSKSRQDPAPWKPTPSIITGGIYRLTRNPMYLGMALIQAAIGFHQANGWMVALVPVSMGLVYLLAIRPEEAYLAEKFGEPYLEYKRSVRRWL